MGGLHIGPEVGAGPARRPADELRHLFPDEGKIGTLEEPTDPWVRGHPAHEIVDDHVDRARAAETLVEWFLGADGRTARAQEHGERQASPTTPAAIHGCAP